MPPSSKNGKLSSVFGGEGEAGAEVASLPRTSLPHCLLLAQKLLLAHLLALSLSGLICSNTPLSLTLLFSPLAVLLYGFALFKE